MNVECTQVGSRTESLKIGDSNILEAKCSVGRHTNLSNGCIVGAGCSLTVTILFNIERKLRKTEFSNNDCLILV